MNRRTFVGLTAATAVSSLLSRTAFAQTPAHRPNERAPKPQVRRYYLIESLSEDYVLSRYPVLKIHPTIARHVARSTIVIVRLMPTLTSAIP